MESGEGQNLHDQTDHTRETDTPSSSFSALEKAGPENSKDNPKSKKRPLSIPPVATPPKQPRTSAEVTDQQHSEQQTEQLSEAGFQGGLVQGYSIQEIVKLCLATMEARANNATSSREPVSQLHGQKDGPTGSRASTMRDGTHSGGLGQGQQGLSLDTMSLPNLASRARTIDMGANTAAAAVGLGTPSNNFGANSGDLGANTMPTGATPDLGGTSNMSTSNLPPQSQGEATLQNFSMGPGSNFRIHPLASFHRVEPDTRATQGDIPSTSRTGGLSLQFSNSLLNPLTLKPTHKSTSNPPAIPPTSLRDKAHSTASWVNSTRPTPRHQTQAQSTSLPDLNLAPRRPLYEPISPPRVVDHDTSHRSRSPPRDHIPLRQPHPHSDCTDEERKEEAVLEKHERICRGIIKKARLHAPTLVSEKKISNPLEVEEDKWGDIMGEPSSATVPVFARSGYVDHGFKAEFKKHLEDRCSQSHKPKGVPLKPRKDKFAPFLEDDNRPHSVAEPNLRQSFLPRHPHKKDPTPQQKSLKLQEETSRRTWNALSYMDALTNLVVASNLETEEDTKVWKQDADPNFLLACMRSMRQTIHHIAELSGNQLAGAVMDRRQDALADSNLPDAIKRTLLSSPLESPALFAEDSMDKAQKELESEALTRHAHKSSSNNRPRDFARPTSRPNTGSRPNHKPHLSAGPPSRPTPSHFGQNAGKQFPKFKRDFHKGNKPPKRK